MLIYVLSVLLLTTIPLLPAQSKKETHVPLCAMLDEMAESGSTKGIGAVCAAMRQEMQKTEAVATLPCMVLARKLYLDMYAVEDFHISYQKDLVDAQYGKEETGWGNVKQARENIIKDLLRKEKCTSVFFLNPARRDTFITANKNLHPESHDAHYFKAAIALFFYCEERHAKAVWRSKNTTYAACSREL